MSLQNRNRVVFVGNIAFDVTEEDLNKLFSEVGPVLSVRIMMDKETGRPKGYGFVEYGDFGTSSSAVRNLNGRQLNGRNLRVSYSVDESTAEQPGSQPPPSQLPPQGGMPPQQGSMPQGDQALEAMTQLLTQMNANQLFDLMSQMKVMAQTNGEQARAILVQNPQLTYALFQAMVMMKVITPQIIQQVLQNAVQQQQMMPPQPQYGMYPGGPQQPGFPPQQPPPPPYMVPNQPPPTSSSGPAPQLPPSMMNLPEQQRQALMQVLQLNDAQIDQLPAAQQQQIRQLRAQIQSAR